MWRARKKMPKRQGIHSCKNGLTCGRKNEFAQTVRQTLCQTARAKSSTAPCRCARRKKCQWKKARARKATATWESTRAACAEKRCSQAHERLVMTIFFRLFQPIVGSFTRNDHVMHVALTQSCAADADEPRLLLQLRDSLGAAIPHAGAHAANKLIHHLCQRSAIRHAAFNSFRHQFVHPIAAAIFIAHAYIFSGSVFSGLRVAFA